jgi:hypothetical protein
MTLKDTNVIDSDSDGDAVEHSGLQSAFKQKILQKRKNQILGHTTLKYMPDADEDAHERILSKYDDVGEVE